jgi:hypothetical protein
MGDQVPNQAEVTVVIDQLPYRVHAAVISAANIRAIPHPPIGPGRDLWLVRDDMDRFLSDEDEIQLVDGMQFFTAPQTITAGAIIDRRGEA